MMPRDIRFVTPAQAGVHRSGNPNWMDSGLRRNDN